MAVPVTIRIEENGFDAAAEVARLTDSRHDIGAVVTFTGLCRGGDDGVRAMTLECYPAMAEHEIASHVAEATARWDLAGVTIIHRHGRLRPGDPIVLVVTASAHRAEAFAAAEFLMDYLKTKAPFWKREECADGASWVSASAADDRAAERWTGSARKE